MGQFADKSGSENESYISLEGRGSTVRLALPPGINFTRYCRGSTHNFARVFAKLVLVWYLRGKAANGSDWRVCLDDYVRGAEGGEDYSEEEGSESGLKTIKLTSDDKW